MPRKLIVEADGASRGNPGPASYGALVADGVTGEVLVELAEPIGVTTNNVAEYRGLIAGLRAAAALDPGAEVEVRMDSKLAVQQMSGAWQVKHSAIRPLAAAARAAFPTPSRVVYTWVPREQNKRADALGNLALDDPAAAERKMAAAAKATGTVLSGPPPMPESEVLGTGSDEGLFSLPVQEAPAAAGGEPGDPARSTAAETGDPTSGAALLSGPAGEGSALAEAPPTTPSPSSEQASSSAQASASAQASSLTQATTPAQATTPTQAASPAQATSPAQAPSPTQASASSPTTSPAWSAPDLGPPTTLLLLRHGATPLTAEKRFSGSGDPELAETGRAQAAAVATRLAARGGIDVIVSSPSRRTRQTAQAVADALGLPVVVEPDFRETDFGLWDGHSFAEVRERWPAELTAWLAAPSAAPPGGESFDAVATRVRAAKERTLERYARQTVLVVSHVTPIKTLIRDALGAPPEALFAMELSAAALSTVAYYADGRSSLRLFNDTGHLG